MKKIRGIVALSAVLAVLFVTTSSALAHSGSWHVHWHTTWSGWRYSTLHWHEHKHEDDLEKQRQERYQRCVDAAYLWYFSTIDRIEGSNYPSGTKENMKAEARIRLQDKLNDCKQILRGVY